MKSARTSYERALDDHQHGRFEQAAKLYASAIGPFVQEDAFDEAVEAFRRLTCVESDHKVINSIGADLLARIHDERREITILAILAFHARHRRAGDWKSIATSLHEDDTDILRQALDDITTRANSALERGELCVTQQMIDLGSSLDLEHSGLRDVETALQLYLAEAPDAIDVEEVEPDSLDFISESLLEPLQDFEAGAIEIDEMLAEDSDVIDLDQVAQATPFDTSRDETTRKQTIPLSDSQVDALDPYEPPPTDPYPELEGYRSYEVSEASDLSEGGQTRRHGVLLHGMNSYRNLRSIFRLASKVSRPTVMVFEDGDRNVKAAFGLGQGGFQAVDSLRGLTAALWTVAEMATNQALCVHFGGHDDEPAELEFDERDILEASADQLGEAMRDQPAARLFAQLVDISDEAWLILDEPDDDFRYIVASRGDVPESRQDFEKALASIDSLSIDVTSLCEDDERVISTNLMLDGALWSFVHSDGVLCLIRTSGDAVVSALGRASAYCW